jgi:NADPH:quinone reductase-like Zn-dependent oxidoreductase
VESVDSQGSLAGVCFVDPDLLAKPNQFQPGCEAAALPLVFDRVGRDLGRRANVRAGKKVLILGGSGGGSVLLCRRQHWRWRLCNWPHLLNNDLVQQLGAVH